MSVLLPICLSCGIISPLTDSFRIKPKFCNNHHRQYHRIIDSRFIFQNKHFLVEVNGNVCEIYDEYFGAHELQQLIYDLIPYTDVYNYMRPTNEQSIFVMVDEEMLGGEMRYDYQIIFLTEVHPDNININGFLHRILQDNNGNEFDGIDGNYTVKIKQINLPTYMHHKRKEWPFINWVTNPLDVEERVVKPNEKSGITKERVIEIARNLGIENIEENFIEWGD